MSRPATRSPSCIIEAVEARRLLAAVIGLSLDNKLLGFDWNQPKAITSTQSIGGLTAGDRVVGIDYRAANSQLYGLVDGTSVDRIVLINAKTGASTNVFNLTTQLVGTEFGVDFNPVADALRITSDADQNLRVPFATGATLVDGTLAYGAADANAAANPNVVGSAYTNSFPGTTATVLYDIDSATDSLAIQNPPNAGTLSTRGPLGVDTGALVGFDIQGATTNKGYDGEAFVSLTRAADAGSRLYRIDLATGGVRDAGVIGKGATRLRDITLVPTGVKQAAPAKGDSDGKGRDRDRDRDYYDSQRYC